MTREYAWGVVGFCAAVGAGGPRSTWPGAHREGAVMGIEDMVNKGKGLLGDRGEEVRSVTIREMPTQQRSG